MSISRQTLWSQKRKAEGLCSCGELLHHYKSLCNSCMSKQRDRMRARRGFNRAVPPFPDPSRIIHGSEYLLSEAALLLLPRSFIPKVQFPENQTCWIWTGQKIINPRYKDSREGQEYGLHTWKARRDDGGWITKGSPAHKLAYESIVGPVPKGLDLDHLCDNKLCVNPKHLEPVTRQINMLRCYERRRAQL